MLNCCPFCCHVAGGDQLGNLANNGTIIVEERFFQLFQRYLNEQRKGTDSSPKTNNDAIIHQFSSPNLTKHLREMGMVTCLGCLQLMRSFCDTYEQFKRLELELDWKVEQIKDLMEGESALMLKYVVQSIDQLEVEDRFKRGATKIINVLEQSKKALAAKCSQKLKSSFPRVSIRKSSPPTPSKQNMGQQFCRKRDALTDSSAAKKSRISRSKGDGEQLSGHPEASSNAAMEDMDADCESESLDGKVNEELLALENCAPKLTKVLSKATQNISNGIKNLDKTELQGSAAATGKPEMIKPLEKISSSSSSFEKAGPGQNTKKPSIKYICSEPKCGKQFTTELGFKIHFEDKHYPEMISPKPDKNSQVEKIGKPKSSIKINIKSKLQLGNIDSTPFIEELPTKDVLPNEEQCQDANVIDLTSSMGPQNICNLNTGVYACEVCPNKVGFGDDNEFHKHYILNHPGLRYECPSPKCKGEFGDPLSVYKHYWRVHRENGILV